jgi:hypothetical protein
VSVDCARWLGADDAPAEPTLLPVVIEPSPEGADDTARLLGVATFNGLCRLLTALADRRLLCADELRGIEDAMTTPLDDPEWRDDDLISAFRNTVTGVAAQSLARDGAR